MVESSVSYSKSGRDGVLYQGRWYCVPRAGRVGFCMPGGGCIPWGVVLQTKGGAIRENVL